MMAGEGEEVSITDTQEHTDAAGRASAGPPKVAKTLTPGKGKTSGASTSASSGRQLLPLQLHSLAPASQVFTQTQALNSQELSTTPAVTGSHGLIETKVEHDAYDAMSGIDTHVVADVKKHMGKLPEPVLKKLSVATRELRKRISTIQTTKERVAKLEAEKALLQVGKVPKRIHIPGMTFECTALEEPVAPAAMDFPISFLQDGLEYTVKITGDKEVKYRTIIETTFIFQQMLKCKAELQTAKMHLSSMQKLSSYKKCSEECLDALKERTATVNDLGIDCGPVADRINADEKAGVQAKVETLFTAIVKAVIKEIETQKKQE